MSSRTEYLITFTHLKSSHETSLKLYLWKNPNTFFFHTFFTHTTYDHHILWFSLLFPSFTCLLIVDTGTHTHTQIHILFSLRPTPLIASESQTGVPVSAVSNSVVTKIGLTCLMVATPVKWKGWEQCEPGHWQQTKRGFVFSDVQLVFVPVINKGRVFRWRVKYLHCTAVTSCATLCRPDQAGRQHFSLQ